MAFTGTENALRSILACRTERHHKSNPVRDAQQPFTGCSDQRLREAGKVIETHEHAVEFEEW